MPTDGDDYIANDFRDPNYLSNISTGGGEDYIWTHIFVPVMYIDGGDGFDIFKIPDGWLGNFTITQTGENSYLINHGQGRNLFYVTNVELIIIDTFDSYLEIFNDPFFDARDNVVDFNNLTEIQLGLFDSVQLYLSSNIRNDLYPDLYNSGDGDDIVYLPDAANYVVHDDSYDPADLIWDYARTFNAGSGDDVVYGGDYHDRIDGGLGDDRLFGGAGDDYLRDNPFDVESDVVHGYINGGSGTDTVMLSETPSRIVDENGVILWTSAGPSSITLEGQRVYAEYRDAAGELIGRVEIVNVEVITGLLYTAPTEYLFTSYSDTVNFNSLSSGQRASIDDLQGSNRAYAMYDALGGDDVVTLPAHDTLVGSNLRWDLSQLFYGNGGDDRITGSNNSDRISGGNDNDRIDGRGGNDVLAGDGGDDELIGGSGADTMTGGSGNDTYHVDDAGDIVTETSDWGEDLVRSSINYVLGPYVENLTLTGSAVRGTGNGVANIITGNSASNILLGLGGNDTLVGGDGDDDLDGGDGDDVMIGGDGSDDYIVNSTNDVIIESGFDIDNVRSTATFTLSAFVENLTLIGTSAINGTGNDLANRITGNSASNVLDGGAGADRLAGGGGDDHYIVDDNGDLVIEAASGGVDIVESFITYRLTDNVENLVLAGINPINATGNFLNNSIYGNVNSNLINGGAGADFMAGGFGNDIYFVDSRYDQIVEFDGQGEDLVYSLVTYTLSEFVEGLRLTGDLAINATGNASDNNLVGNAANNVIDGGAGADIMRGGAGDDSFHVDDAGDRVVENAGEGIDTVISSVTYALRSNIENLTLTGTAVRAAGNNLANRLVGNDSDNVINGGFGADIMRGGLGNDIYYVETAGDRTIEEAGAGRDRVYTLISLTLEANVEDVFMRGSAALNATGNALDNVLRGNSGNNVLTGAGGADDLQGAGGADTFVFRDGDFAGLSPSTSDRIIDFNRGEGDTINLSAVDAMTGLGGNQAFSFIGTGNFTGAAGQLRYQVVNGNTYVTGDTNGDGVADFMIRLDGSHNLVGGDFIL